MIQTTEHGASRDDAQIRLVRIELVTFGSVARGATVPAEAARSILDQPMPRGQRWRIEPPDPTGRRPDDAGRYAADCVACGENNPYTSVGQPAWRRAG